MQFALQNSDWRRILLSDSTTPKADLDNRFCIVEWNKSAFGVVESLNKILRQSEFCNANCIGMNIN